MGKKPNVRFVPSDPEPNQIQPVSDRLQKLLQTVLANQCKQEALLWQRDHAMRSSVEILQLQNIPFEN